ncbi:hypothetical protein [Mucilaginibacter gotjawali]|uniref:Uncharacterized protein n=2 Tax=Mucilaginibacter gotjawali TaxID=1550579 RepID=A0A839SCP2_9SPHI|nr:hypothetical protein [Mucilaginibacter gotjawali]MBB3055082.1 hypothetical protein [Mucilaginibacter gotjawali]BAU56301.1 hypothetical protein MgSA37_04498 [Mucilaginibacter gotjawali]
MSSKKQPERRTFLQDRFDILIKRQKSGKATFSELTELDEIVNRDPELREKVIRESMLTEGYDDFEEPMNHPQNEEPVLQQVKRRSLLSHIKSLITRIFNSQIITVKTGNVILRSALLSF